MKIVKYIIISVAVFLHQTAFAQHSFNGPYTGANTDHIAFPIGGIGAGMFCLEGNGAISHFSVRNHPELYNEPPVFAAISVKGHPEFSRVLEGPVPDWKKTGLRAGQGSPGTTWGLERFRSAAFISRFPFATVRLQDKAMPLTVSIKGWSPFIPADVDDSSLPAGALEYTIKNTGKTTMDFVFSYNAPAFFGNQIDKTDRGFILADTGSTQHPEQRGSVAFFTDDPHTVVNPSWFRGGFWDGVTMAWKAVHDAAIINGQEQDGSPGASLYIPFHLKPGESKTISLRICWYVQQSNLRINSYDEATTPADFSWADWSKDQPSANYQPWYASRFNSIEAVMGYWSGHYDELKTKTGLFTDAFYGSSLPPEVLEAVSANMSILKSTTILRQYDGRFWGWEGSDNTQGSCPGSCTHVYNYAQSLCHLFPSLERSMRETEFLEDESTAGNQCFRAQLPIRPEGHISYPAADGQLGGIIKVYRDWHISGDSAWIRQLYPRVKLSLDFCIHNWDPYHQGTIAEPHHNTYDIEFWGAEPLCTGFYAGALEAFIRLNKELGRTDSLGYYQALLNKAQTAMETSLWNGDYFRQQVQWKGLAAGDPVANTKHSLAGDYSPEGVSLLQKEGPRYQFGQGCLSDGMLGPWLCELSGLPVPFDESKLKRHLAAVYRYNFRPDLSMHNNPQRPTYAWGHEGGLLLCSWPKGGQPSLPFVYSNEVWTGIEYEVASHLIMEGETAKGLSIIRTLRKRYDGTVRNPFDEYECGHWYARAMSSYALLQAFTGVRYDAVDQTLYFNSKAGDFTSFISTNTGFGQVIYQGGKAHLKVFYGAIPVKNYKIND
jgi:uncharacterized protein (DUF608 family)